MGLHLSQLSVRALMLAVAAAATNLAAASLVRAAPFLQRTPAAVIVAGLFTIGVLLPALWLGASRRLGCDALLAHIAVVGLLASLFCSAIRTEVAVVALTLVSAYFVAAVVIPSVAWYVVRVMEPGEPRERAERRVKAYVRGAAHLGSGFIVWPACLVIVYRVVG